ncbi:MAG TPA: 3-oxoacyl-ACP reductase FabG [Actinomycetota bacterium]|nr:3-oxoacyl-ACP reductase FabG [Actinomycetota bacterium]
MRRTAVVTGASRGIGRAIAVALAPDHAVAVNYRAGADEAKETLRLVEAAGGEGIAVSGDVRDPDAVDALFAEVERELGPVGVLVNNAGVRADALAPRLSDDEWRRVVDTNLYGTFACTRRALRPMLRAGWGRVVNVASVAALAGNPGQTSYCAAKAGVVGMTRALAREVGRKGITVNAVAPGLVDTDLVAGLTAERREALLSSVPAGRTGEPEEVAAVVAFLCSDPAAYVNGSILTVDGGMTA